MDGPENPGPREPAQPAGSASAVATLDPAMAAQIVALINAELGSKVLPTILQGQAAISAQLDAQVSKLAASIPTVDQVAAHIRQQAQQGLAQDVSDVERRLATNGNGHGNASDIPAQTEAAPTTKGDIKEMITMVFGGISGLLKEGVPQYIALQDMQMRKRQIELAQTNPVMLARLIASTDPMNGRFLGMMLAADPWQQQIPGLVTNAVDASNRAVLSGLIRSGLLNPAHIAPGVLGPAAPLAPGQPQPSGLPANPVPQNPTSALPVPSPNGSASPIAGDGVAPASPSTPMPGPPPNAPTAPVVGMAQRGRTIFGAMAGLYDPILFN